MQRRSCLEECTGVLLRLHMQKPGRAPQISFTEKRDCLAQECIFTSGLSHLTSSSIELHAAPVSGCA